MYPFKQFKIQSYEIGLHFHDGEFRGLIGPGKFWRFDPLNKMRVDIVSQRDPWLTHEKLDLIVKSGELTERTVVLDLADHERGLVWIDNRFSHALPPGLYAYWTGYKDVRVEVIEMRVPVRFEHPELKTIARSACVNHLLDTSEVERDHAGVLFVDGQYVETLPPGHYAFWQGVAPARIVGVDLREATLDVSGQEIMTKDNVTLRMNAIVNYAVVDAARSVRVVNDAAQGLYRAVQLALRTFVGTRELEELLVAKESLSAEMNSEIRTRAEFLGLEIRAVGIRDIMLPGDMKELMNKVTEAKKAAEANLISRREETAAIRSQVNTAKLLEDNPALMRLRELEVLERVATNSQLSIIAGENGLAERVIKLL